MSGERVVLAGVGLINGSLALGLRSAGGAGEIVGLGRDAERLAAAEQAGVIDRGETDAAPALAGADTVVIGVPMGAVRPLLERMAPHLGAGTVLTDVGSTKGSVWRDAAATLSATQLTRFIPGHPIAGTERSGFEAAYATLFQGRRVILTPGEGAAPDAIGRVRGLWQACGAEVIEMDVEHHDRMLAATSHLPHLLAYGLVDTLGRWDATEEVFQYAAGGFRDFTRIASSDPVMWRDICLANREALLETLAHYRDDLERLTDLIRDGDAAGLESVFDRAKTIRDRYRPVFEK